MLIDVVLSIIVLGLIGVVFYLFKRLSVLEKENGDILKAMTTSTRVIHQLAEFANVFQTTLNQYREAVGNSHQQIYKEIDDLRASVDEFVITVVNQVKSLTTIAKPAVKVSNPSALPAIKKNDNKPN